MNDLNKKAKRWKKCWHAAPDIYALLKDSTSADMGRQKIMNYLHTNEVAFRNDFYELNNAQFVLFLQAAQVLRNIFSKRNERIANVAPIEYIWKAAHFGDSEVEDGFIEEFEHLFKAIKGHSHVYPSFLMEGAVSPDFEKYQGRDAANKRSVFLDELGNLVDSYINRYPDGLRPDIAERRAENKKKILKVFHAKESDWKDFRWHYRNIIRDSGGLEKLKKVVKITASEEKAMRLSMEHGLPFAITPHYLHLMDEEPSEYDYAVRCQVFPSLAYVNTMISHKTDRAIVFDFMREHDTSPVDNVTRRYIKVATLKPVDTCPQICIYCQRNWEINSPCADVLSLSKRNVDNAISWIAQHKQIKDILITGGDPLVMDNHSIDDLLLKLSKIDHLSSIRIASRVLVTAPNRIDDELLTILSGYHETGKRTIYMVTHFEHPYEICGETAEATDRLRKCGIMIYNQQVFTFANSRRFESVALRMALKNIGIDPYYLFNMKAKSEMMEYSVPVSRILQERKEEARLLPGIFRTDEAVFNVPFLGKNNINSWQDHELISIKPTGERVYAFHPWEKNIREIDSYIYTDVPIKGYLEKLKDHGEDPEEYRSIWYYY